MTASSLGRRASGASQMRPDVVDCKPMSHQNSGDHGYEMHPQQFVRLVGCHDAPAPHGRPAEDGKPH